MRAETVEPTMHLQSLIKASMMDKCNISAAVLDASRTELDSHANMPVVGKYCYIINDTGKEADVNAFTPDHMALRIPIIDPAIQYDCPYEGTEYILVIRNALFVYMLVLCLMVDMH